MASIAVIIVSYNTCLLLRACLDSLANCTLPLRTVMVDNGSRDGSQAMVRATFPEVELMETGANLGFAAGNNFGMRALGIGVTLASQAPGDPPEFILLLNPDTIVHVGAIEALAAFLRAHPRVGVVGPRLLNVDGSVQPAAFRFPTMSMAALDLFPPGEVLPGRLYGSWWHGRYAEERAGAAPFAIDHPLGACMLVRRAVVEQIGGMDEAFFMYSEEIDWCYRARKAGWAIWQEPAARVTHFGGAATSQFRGAMQIELWRSRAQFAHKHYGAGAARLLRLLLALGMLRQILRDWLAFACRRLPLDALRERLWVYGQTLRV